MFCHKCGNKLSDDALFCSECGTKIENDLKNHAAASSPSQEESEKVTNEDAAVNIEEVYDRLNRNKSECPKIKDIDFLKQKYIGVKTPTQLPVITIKGKFCRYNFDPAKNFISITKLLLFWLIALPFTICDAIFFQYLIQEEYYLPLTIIFIMESLIWFIILRAIDKEEKEITQYINKTLGLSLKLSKLNSIIQYIINCVFMIIGCIVLCFCIKETMDDRQYRDYGEYLDYDEYGNIIYSSNDVVERKADEADETVIKEGDISDLCYYGLPLTKYIGGELWILYETLGMPEYGTPVDGSQYYGGDYFVYDDGVMFINDSRSNTIGWITGPASAVTVHDIPLNMTRSKLVELLGTADSEGSVYDEMNDRSFYRMEYILDEVVVTLEMNDADSIAENFSLSAKEDMQTEDSGYGTSAIDFDLVGRWRSHDGGLLEFDEYGNILNCDFNCWSISDSTPSAVYWQTDNGRVHCTAYFDFEYEYEIIPPPENTTLRETLVLSATDFERMSGDPGDGITGAWGYYVWEFSNKPLWTRQFNEDGTGLLNGKYQMTSWYTYQNENGTDMLCYRIVDPTYFDYKVTGETLTVFLDSGSRIYTKVGN